MKMTRLVVGLWVVAVGGCGGGAKQTGKTSPVGPAGTQAAAPVVGEYVVIAHGANLFASASSGAPQFHTDDPGRGISADVVFGGVVLKVRAVKGDWVEVENPTSEQLTAHCNGALTELASFELHFFVRLADVAEVVRRRFEHSYPDGTKLALLAGLPTGPASDGRYPVQRTGFALQLALPAGTVARSYAPDPARFTVPEEGVGSVGEKAELTLGEGKSRIVTSETIGARNPTVQGALTLVELGDICVQATALAKSDQVSDSPPWPAIGTGEGIGGGGVSDVEHRYLHVGTPLFWADGTAAGKSRADIDYPYWHQSKSSKDHACIVHDLALPWDFIGPNDEYGGRGPAKMNATSVVLCFPHADTTEPN